MVPMSILYQLVMQTYSNTPVIVEVFKKSKPHIGEKPFRCDMCEATFSEKLHLVRHLTTHTGEKAFHCNICVAAFTQKPA